MNSEIKILLVDDDPDVLAMSMHILKKQGYQLYQASNGQACKAQLQTMRPDMILLDVVLPDTTGNALCREIKSDPALKGIFIVLISSMKISSDEQADGLDDGADGYIARPITNREFKARVNAMVRILLAERERDELIVELKAALAKVKQLSGLLPICCYCKKIRDDEGYWNQLEVYLAKHSEAKMSHGICPDCVQQHYPGMNLSDPKE